MRLRASICSSSGRAHTSNCEKTRGVGVITLPLGKLGYHSQHVRSEPIRNNQNATLYYLVYASKSDRGDKIWQSITKNKPSGQKGWDF